MDSKIHDYRANSFTTNQTALALTAYRDKLIPFK